MKLLNQWFHKPLGRAAAESIRKQFDAFGISVNGECLQIGTDMPILSLNQKVQVLMPEIGLGGDIISKFDALPFLNESFPMVFMPFTLEGLKNISAVLNEAERVLTADGYLVIAGMNPWSLWGATRILNERAIWSDKIHWRSSLRMYSVLSFRGFQVHWIKSFFYRPPLSSKNGLTRLRYLEPVGNMLWPYPGALYLLAAQKRTVEYLPTNTLWKKSEYVFGKV